MQKIKAHIVYSGQNDWLHANLILENGACLYGHLCSHTSFMKSDLWERREERHAIIKEMGYELEIVGEPSRTLPEGIEGKNKDVANYKEFSDLYKEVEKRLYPKEKQ